MKQPNEESNQLEEIECQKDFGVRVSSFLKPTLHCLKVANKAMPSLKLLILSFDILIHKNFNILPTIYIQAHLEHCIPAVVPFMVQNFKELENIQKKCKQSWINYSTQIF